MTYNKTLRGQFPFLWKLCFLYGICYLLLAYGNFDGIGSGIFAGISAGFILLAARRLKEHQEEGEQWAIAIDAGTIFYFVAASLVSFGNCLTDNFFVLCCNHAASFLLFSIACIKLFYNDRRWDFGKYTEIMFIFWMQTLEMLPVPFQDFREYRKNTEKKDAVSGTKSATRRYVLIGLVIGCPILLVITLLLASADQVFSDLLGRIFDFENLIDRMADVVFDNLIHFPVGFAFHTLLIYLVFAALCKGGFKEQAREARRFGTAIAVTVFSMIDVVYLLFTGIQFLYLFAGGLPDGYVYAEYARKGFFELLIVSLINFILVLFCNRHFVKNIPLQAAMTITSFCTFVMILSSAYRMFMYVSAYHLTFLRVFVLWFLLLLAFFMAGSTISIYKENWNSFRYCLLVLTVLYIVLALSGADSWIAKYNVAQFESAWQQSQGNSTYGTIPSLKNYLPSDYEDSKSYALALSGLGEKYGEALGDKNMTLIREYLQVSSHFYDGDYYENEYDRDSVEDSYGERERDYDVDHLDDVDEDYDGYGSETGQNNWGDDYEEGFVLEENAAIYDGEISNSIVMWKHFNFVENACYQKCKEAQDF